MLKQGNAGRESLLDTIEKLRDERDTLYSATVQPYREVIRALKILEAKPLIARRQLEDALTGLEHVSALYREYTNR